MQNGQQKSSLWAQPPVAVQTDKKYSILIVDDNADLVNLSKIMLEMNGYEVFTALSGSQALMILDEMNKPDLILLDMQMGDMPGPDFLNKLEINHPDIVESVPVVFLSGVNRVPESCAVGFMQKPVPMSLFLAAVERYIQQGVVPVPLQYGGVRHLSLIRAAVNGH